MNRKHLLYPLLAVVALAFAVQNIAGCVSHQWVTVKHLSAAESLPDNEPQITPTDLFKDKSKKLKVIAYRPPDWCRSQGVGEATGETAANRDVIKTLCGVWLAELERAFAAKGYEVISWLSLTEGMADKNQGGDFALEMARKRGVQILLVINSLESGVVAPERQIETRTEFYNFDQELADAMGDPVELDCNSAKSIAAQIPATAWVAKAGISATLDVTAIDPATNRALWFFRQSLTRPADASKPWIGYFYCANGACSRFYHRQPTADDTCDQTGSNVSSIVTQREIPGQVADPYKKELYQLIRSVVKNLLTEFSR